jgi:hypothetical protein
MILELDFVFCRLQLSCEHNGGVCGGFRLLNFLFMFDPTKRATAEECLQSSYFQVWCFLYFSFYTRRFRPRVRARALRAPLFLGLLKRKMERCAPPTPPIAASLILPAILIIYGENPAKNPDSEKNPRKCTTSHIVQQCNCRWH